MVKKEIRELNTYFKTLNIKIILHPENIEKEFTKIDDLKKYIENECQFWNSVELPSNTETNFLRSSFNQLNDCLRSIENAVTLSDSKNTINVILSLISEINNNHRVFYTSTTDVQFFKKFLKNINYNLGLFDFLFLSKSGSIQNDKDYLTGQITAYMYKDMPNIFSEKVKISEHNLENIKQDYSDKLFELENNYEGIRIKRKNSLVKFKKSLNEWKNNKIKNIDDDLLVKNENFNKLETLYKEKLRLEGACTYWSDISSEYGRKARNWIIITIITSISFVIYLNILLYNPPKSLKMIETASINIFRPIIEFALISSVAVYLIRLFVKLALSSIHLSRDASERLQLTHIYMALKNDGSVLDEDRKIILSSLFSRADTGLLKEDSSPTMPNISSISSLSNMAK